MKKSLPVVLIALALFALGSCGRGEFTVSTPDPAVLSAFTSGTVSAGTTIVFRFAADIAAADEVNAAVKEQYFAFDPGIDGATVWSDARTLEFRPSQKLKSGQQYRGRLFLGQVLKNEGAGEFRFLLNVIDQSFEITVDSLKIIDQRQSKSLVLPGLIRTADSAPAESAEKILSAVQDGRTLTVAWTHGEGDHRHEFVISGITRGDKPSEVVVAFNGGSIGSSKEGKTAVAIPAIQNFEILSISPVKEQEQYVEIAFSDPIRANQDLRGLITVAGQTNLRFQIESNIVKVYNLQDWPVDVTVVVHPGIANVFDYQLKGGKTEKVVFQMLEPAVRFLGKGAILPTTNGLTLPIETLNLNTVIVEVVHVFDDNMDQFFQVNRHHESDEINRVGRPVWKKAVPVGWDAAKRNRWVRSGLDLTELTKKYPRGLFRITLTFRRQHIEYTCAAAPAAAETEAVQAAASAAGEDPESSYWDFWDQYQEMSEDDYEQRKNPCSPSFYRHYYDHNITVARNVQISDIGLIAKKSPDETLLVIATDIKTAQPLGGVNVTVVDYQKQTVAQGSTGGDGMLTVKCSGQPFLVIAAKDDQKGYLRVDPGTALSVSQFDAAGETSKKGLRGFLYGERGVWRPGDPVYLTFILLDTLKTLPASHPVILRLTNPKGQLVKTVTQTKSENGFYHFKLQTDAEAPTGDWQAQVMVGGEVFGKTLKIETIMPNRLKIGLDFGANVTALSGDAIPTTLSAAWLHGATAGGLKAEVNATFQPLPTRFSAFPDFTFDDPTRTYSPESENIFAGYLDEAGQASFQTSIDAGKTPPGMLTANFNTKVFEPSGAFSVDRYSLPYHPYRRYIGLRLPQGDRTRGMLLTDVKHKADIVAVDTDGKPVKQARVKAELYKVEWRWWWEKEEEDLANYIGRSSYQPLAQGEVELKNGRGSWPFEIKYPDWGRYFIHVSDLAGDHNTGKIVYIDWPGWAGRAQTEGSVGASMLSFSADKEKYAIGERITLTIPAAAGGRGVVSIEAGGKILSTEYFTPAEKETTCRYSFTATAAMAPNIYAHVTYLQPHLQARNDLPIRLYGLLPILVENPATRLAPVIACAAVFQPESKAVVEVSEKSGAQMTYTLAVVDEGLLGLTRFATPDPWKHFFQRQAVAVGSWDLYDYITAAYGGKLEQLLAIGGGEGELLPDKGRKADRFPPLVRYYGPFTLAAHARKSHSVDIPLYVGAVRVMVVAGNGSAFGWAEKSVQVKKPLMVQGTLPRVMSVKEECSLPVSVFTTEAKIRDVNVRVSAQGPLAVDGASSQTVSFKEPGDNLVTFRLKAQSGIGIAKVTITAAGGGETISQTIEIDVRVPSSPVVDVIGRTLPPGQSAVQEVPLPGLPGTNELTLEVSRIPPLNLEKRLHFLIRYPYGCIEQTTSSVFPQLYLPKLLELSSERQQSIQRNIEAGILRLQSFQTADGGFCYWPGSGGSDEWASNYAGHFLLEAQRLGYHVPASLLSQWQKYERQRAINFTSVEEGALLMQSYRLYCLALSNQAEIGAMNRLRENLKLSPPARWQLAAAYSLAGQKEAAHQLVLGQLIVFRVYRELSHTYGSDLRDKAIVLEAMSLMNDWSKTDQLVREISDGLCKDEWLSTQTTAYCLVAMARYAGIREGSGSMKWSYAVGAASPTEKQTDRPLAQVPLPTANGGPVKVTVANKGAQPLYTRLIAKGLPEPGQERAASSGLELSVDYTGRNLASLSPETLEQGTELTAEFRVRNPTNRPYQELALAALFPSGWEIHNLRMDGGGAVNSEYDYLDIRDDRVHLFFDLKAGETKTFRIQCNASYLGRFYLPLQSVEAMYDASINARVSGRWVTVTAK